MMVMMVVTTIIIVTNSKLSMMGIADNHDFFFDTLPYATRYPGGRCRLHLHLESSKEVVSTEFTP